MKPPSDYRVILAAKNEGVDYLDDTGVQLTPDEEGRILSRVVKYLSRIRWPGVFPRSYSVRIVREPFGADLPHAN